MRPGVRLRAAKLLSGAVAGGLLAGLAFSVIVALPVRSSAAPALPEPVLQRLEDPRAMAVAHRACWQGSSENSLASLQSCIDQGVDAAEVDVRLTKDGELVLMHDSTLDRTTTLTGRVADHTLQQLRRAKLRPGLGGAKASPIDATIPTLGEALQFARGRLILFIDRKCARCETAIGKAIETARAEDWVVMIGDWNNETVLPAPWAKRQTIVWINDCRQKRRFPAIKSCFDRFVDGIESFRGDRPRLLLSHSRDIGFFTDGMDVRKYPGVRFVFNPYIEENSAITSEPAFEQSRRQWHALLAVTSPIIIDEFPGEMVERMKASGKH